MNKKGELFICGLGIDKLNDITLNTIKILKTCNHIYYIHGDVYRINKLMEKLKIKVDFLDSLRIKAIDYKNNYRKKINYVAKKIYKNLKEGKKVAYLTYGHPMLLSDGNDIYKYMYKKKIIPKIVNATSSIDIILSILIHHNKNIFLKGFYLLELNIFLSFKNFNSDTTYILLGINELVNKKKFILFKKKLINKYNNNYYFYIIKEIDNREEIIKLKIQDIEKIKEYIDISASMVLPIQ